MAFTLDNDYEGMYNEDSGLINSREQSAESKMKHKSYPNPFIHEFNISLSTEQAESYEFNLFDTNGRLVNTQNGELKEGTNQIEISDLNGLVPGIYIYRVQTSSGLFSGKVFKYE